MNCLVNSHLLHCIKKIRQLKIVSISAFKSCFLLEEFHFDKMEPHWKYLLAIRFVSKLLHEASLVEVLENVQISLLKMWGHVVCNRPGYVFY